ncbi:SDR family oxidoreductase [Geminisphaera colitermitum]|uniref:SDR family oxidoreductase n=1 Tax=Geminisphaera colitermitum TaxID=1148786 RepID=UPI0001964EF8|nr:SDR family oxidoreductase [Geminisphaera colitermitum]
MKDLANHTVVITGASSGIGLEAAKCFARSGCRLALLARSAGKLKTAATEIIAAAPDAPTPFAIPCDVTDEAAVATAFAQIAQEFDSRIDILINNAGVGFATDLATCTFADYRRILETNLTGVFLCTRAVLPGMKACKSGHIINVSSIVGKVANPNAPLYCASKHALNGYTDGLRQQVAADRIRVSLVSPSGTDTAYWDGRTVDRSELLKPSEVAAAIHFVASQPDGVLIKDIDLTAHR